MFAMEDETELDTNAEASVEDDVADIRFEQDVVEIEADGRDLDDGVESVDRTLDDVSTLSDIGDVMEESVENGEGLDEDTAEITQIAVESIYRRLGLRKAKPMPSLESFSTKNTRVHATRIALEETRSQIGKIGSRLVEWIQRMIQHVVDMVKKAWIAITQWGLKKRVDAVVAAAKALKDDSAKKVSGIENAALGKVFNEKGHIVDASSVYGFVERTTKFISAVREAIDAAIQNQTKFEGIAKNVTSNVTLDEMVIDINKLQKAIDDTTELDLSRFVNQIQLKIQTAFGSSDAQRATFYKLVQSVGSATPSTVVELATANDLKDVADAIGELHTSLEAITKDVGKLTTISKSVNKAIDKIEADTAKQTDAVDVSKKINLYKQTLVAEINLLNALIGKAISIGTITAKAAIQYCNVSLKAHDAPASSDKKPSPTAA